MLIKLTLLATIFSSVMMTSSPPPPPTTSQYHLFKLEYLSNVNNSNAFPSNISLGELMIQACSSEAEATFEQRKAPPKVIACCQALTIADCMVQQCRSIFTSHHQQNDSKASDNPIVECSQMRLAALSVNMNAVCELVHSQNLSLTECATLPLTANLGLVAALMIAAFLLITILCGLYMWAQNKLRRRKERGGEPKVASNTAVVTPRPQKSKSVLGKTLKKNSSNYSPLLARKGSRVKSNKMVLKSVKGLKRGVGSKLEPPLKRASQSKIKLAVKSSNSTVKKLKKQ